MKFFFSWFFTVSNSITRLHFCSRFSWQSIIGTGGWMTQSSCLILRRFMLLIPKQNQLPELKFWWGYLFVNISFKTTMTILLMLLVDVEWLFASLPLEFWFFFLFFLFWLPFDFDESLCLSSLVVGPCLQIESGEIGRASCRERV